MGGRTPGLREVVLSGPRALLDTALRDFTGTPVDRVTTMLVPPDPARPGEFASLDPVLAQRVDPDQACLLPRVAGNVTTLDPGLDEQEILVDAASYLQDYVIDHWAPVVAARPRPPARPGTLPGAGPHRGPGPPPHRGAGARGGDPGAGTVTAEDAHRPKFGVWRTCRFAAAPLAQTAMTTGRRPPRVRRT